MLKAAEFVAPERFSGRLNAPRSINSTKPFVSCAQDYMDRGWGVLPLPRRRKEYPPTGFTGRAGKFADDEDILRWLNDVQYSEGNIAIRVGNMLVVNGVKYEVIGIDVDAHSGKKGARELQNLCKKLGPLPDTWTSSSRNDGISGIRFYLVPYGYGFKGKASDSIDIVQRVHRYAVVYPSWHPDTQTQYFWYEPGNPCDGTRFTQEIPVADALPVLPDTWIDHLTAGRQKDDQGYGIDLDSSWDDVMAWRAKHFNVPLPDCPGGMCPRMQLAVTNAIAKIENSPSNHDKITAAHWNLISLAVEGHSGYKAAIEEVEAVWVKDIMAKGKRPLSMIKREMVRSLIGTFRKMKAKAEAFADQGFSLFMPECCILDDRELKIKVTCELDGKPWIYRVPLSKDGIDPKDYDKNDRGMADMFFDRVGDNVRYLADYNGWIIYDGITWHIDDFTHIRDLFHRACVKPCKKAGLRAQTEFFKHLATGGTKDDAIGRPLKSAMDRLLWIAENYGNDSKVKGMLNQLKSIPGIGMKYTQLNSDTTILAMPNGKCIKLDEPDKVHPKAKGFTIVDNRKEYFTTMSTGAELLDWGDISDYEKRLWKGYLDTFLPDRVYRMFVQKALGHCIIGGNPEKYSIWLVGISNTGKSTMLQAIQGAIADYGGTFQPNAIFKDSGTGNNPELGNLLHKRMIFTSETGSQRVHGNPLKRNSGNDTVSVTRKYANAQITQIPHFTIVPATNQAPIIEDADEALIKRILVLPFMTQVLENKDDKRMDVILRRDARHAVLNWLVYGYRLYVREGLSFEKWHDLSKAATASFTAELSDVATFVTDICHVCPEEEKRELLLMSATLAEEKRKLTWQRISVTGLYQAYTREFEAPGAKLLGPKVFGKKVRDLFGLEKTRRKVDPSSTSALWVYVGLRWKDEQAMNQIKV